MRVGVIIGLALLPSCAMSTSRLAIVPENMSAIPDQLHFSPAVRSGDLIFVSGVVAGWADEGREERDMEAAVDRAFRTLSIILAEADVDWDSVVEITSYHTDLPAQAVVFARVKDRYVRAPYPAWTAIDVDRLWPDTGFAEIRIVARATGPTN